MNCLSLYSSFSRDDRCDTDVARLFPERVAEFSREQPTSSSLQVGTRARIPLLVCPTRPAFGSAHKRSQIGSEREYERAQSSCTKSGGMSRNNFQHCVTLYLMLTPACCRTISFSLPALNATPLIQQIAATIV